MANSNGDSSAHARPTVHGLAVSPATQCAHWASPLDIIAVKHACCRKFYACICCHNACEAHEPEVWTRDRRAEKAVLCGACGHVLSVQEYMESGSRCPECREGFNPACKAHWGLYFELEKSLCSMVLTSSGV
ncbi:zinc finger CHY domain-containing protein [Massariosphaeria phaeospora]|uniref:Zinc finger CHY domain-containing protein n=1 Tax=Massariosphaeria phaeospora TaxID=100035 RepID=A0A7C8MNM9_9PLEO|nr:zinc finger CHY domain-containing protein [Massariosphaeria phaeospora]